MAAAVWSYLFRVPNPVLAMGYENISFFTLISSVNISSGSGVIINYGSEFGSGSSLEIFVAIDKIVSSNGDLIK